MKAINILIAIITGAFTIFSAIIYGLRCWLHDFDQE
jgi:hypothetical protein